jgi:hypothetical protein
MEFYPHKENHIFVTLQTVLMKSMKIKGCNNYKIRRACQTLSSILIPKISGSLIGVKATQSKNFITLSMTLFRLIQSSNQFGNQGAHREENSSSGLSLWID